jgi:hypothetical protein
MIVVFRLTVGSLLAVLHPALLIRISPVVPLVAGVYRKIDSVISEP